MGAKLVLEADNVDITKELFERACQVALEEIGLVAERHAKENLYPGHGFDTGNLQGSITHATSDVSAFIGTNVEYAPYVELGTSKMSASPFLRPAVEEHGDEYRTILSNRLQHG